MSEYSEKGKTIKLDALQKELDKIIQKREIKEQLTERIKKPRSFFDLYGSLILAISIVSILFIIFIYLIAW